MFAVRTRGVVLAAVAAFLVSAAGGSAASREISAGVYTGYGFDACTAPSIPSLQAWSASPYRALGIYLGGVNRACANANLTSAWVTSATGLGWSLLPLYVGLQAPCVSQSGLQKIPAATAAAKGIAAADDAVADAAALGLPTGSPIYYDMEGYPVNNASCSKTVQTFVGAWVTELRAQGFVAGVYGSAASTIRDVAALTDSQPDVIWIANWNGVEGVFGDPYVSDDLWPDHARVHQYRGGHKETWAGVTINIDNNYVDSLTVQSPTVQPPPPPPPVGQVNSGDGFAVATWPDGTFAAPAVVTLTPTSQPPSANGYAVQLTAADQATTQPLPGFGAPITIHILKQATGLLPVFSVDGASWQPIPRLTTAGVSTSVPTAFALEPDGTVDIQTLVPGYFGLLADVTPPTRPPAFAARLVGNELVLTWQAATDDSGQIGRYQVLLDGTPAASLAAKSRRTVVRNFHRSGITVYRIRAVDPAGNVGQSTSAAVVSPKARPKNVPRAIPRWAFALYTWQRTKTGKRPAAAPHTPPAWYWAWAGWRSSPFKLKAPPPGG
jgi:hypothetical protein